MASSTPELLYDPPTRILVGVLAIDRDKANVDRVRRSILHFERHCRPDLMVVTRERDTVVRGLWSERGAAVVTVPDYEIRHRHNLWKIADKRNLVREHANRKGYEAIVFVDSDIVFKAGVAKDMMNCSRYADVVVAPGEQRWTKEHTVGVFEDGAFRLLDARELAAKERYPRIHGGGMGCTMIRSTALDIPFVPMQLGSSTAGEDVGFFYKLHTERPDLVCRITSWPHFPVHLL